MRRIGRLHVLTVESGSGRAGPGCDPVELVRLALRGGADTIQYREKRLSTREQIATARALVRLCREAGVRLIVNDRVDVALAADAGGVHLGEEDFPIALARDLLGPDRVIGASAATAARAVEAMWAGADYIGAGPVFATDRKGDAGAPVGLEGLEAIVRAVEIPVVAIGGITRARVPEILATGARGIAVIQAVALDPDPEAAARALRAALAWESEPPAPGSARGGAEGGR